MSCSEKKISEAANDAVLIVIEENAESMDVERTQQVFATFGMPVHFAARANKQVQLTRGVCIKPNMTMFQATRQEWKIIVLPGGNKAATALMKCRHFGQLLEQHLKFRKGLVAAMGASATHTLLALGYIDPLGPTIYPLKDGTVVNKEFNHQVWTAPGLGTSTELALAIGQHLYGETKASRVAIQVGYLPGQPWHIRELHDLESRKLPNVQFWQNGGHWNMAATGGFWDVVWPVLADRGWTSEHENRFWIFMKPDLTQKLLTGRGKDCFQSIVNVLDFLHEDEESQPLLLKFYVHVARKLKKTPSRTDKNTKRKRSEATSEDKKRIFRKVVWKCLRDLGWKKRLGVYVTPSSHAPKAELESTEQVLTYLRNEPAFRLDEEVLEALDSYHESLRRCGEENGSN